jgi:hypothetical protein
VLRAFDAEDKTRLASHEKVPVMIANSVLTSAGVLPFRSGPIRFAVGPPDGLTSNSWKIWTTKAGDVYVACRDNFKEVKVSLHASGRWRMGFTTEAVTQNTNLLAQGQNRAWEIWDRPPETLPDTVIAFHLIFPTSELAVRPEQRDPSDWKRVMYIEAAPSGKVTTVTLFITRGDVTLKHDSEPSFVLASLDIGSGLYAQLVVHGDPEGDLQSLLEDCVIKARQQAESKGIKVPDGAYVYFWGYRNDGSRFLVGAHAAR